MFFSFNHASSAIRKNLRMASGLVLFLYIASHLLNHALGLISLDAAEAGMGIAIEVWYSLAGTVLLYGAAVIHFFLALWAVYERRTFLLPPLELVRVALGFALPILLIGHFAATRLAYDLFGLDSAYTRVVANLWATGSQGWQLGLMAPGWLHGCLGLHFAFNRRPLYRQLRFVLFGIALVLPVLSAAGFLAMGRELAVNPQATAAALEYLGPQNAAQRLAITEWKDWLLNGYFTLIGAAFAAREIRNLVERRRNQLVSVSYPDRTVRVPRGWSVLEASRGFHLPHASMCGGRARCSTCRVQVTAGADACPPPGIDEQATLERIGAPHDVRLGCQLRPHGDIAVNPLVRTALPIYRPKPAPATGEKEIVVLYCDFRNRADLGADHLPQDLLYVLTLYVEGLEKAIRAYGGNLSYVEPNSVCALFGFRGTPERAAQQALQAAGAIAGVIADLNDRLGRSAGNRLKISVTIHAGRAAVGEFGAPEAGALLAVGEAIDAANALRRVVAERDRSFAISEPVYAAAGLNPTGEERTTVRAAGSDRVVLLFDAPPVASPDWTLHGRETRGASLRRLWAG